MSLTKPCFRPELDLFSTRAYQTEILKTELIELKPVNSLLNASFIEFISFGFFDSYRDCFNAYIKLEVVLDDGSGVVVGAKAPTTAAPAPPASSGVQAPTAVSQLPSNATAEQRAAAAAKDASAQKSSSGGGAAGVDADVKTSCVNNLLGSMFSQCNVFLNTKPISAQETNLPIRHYIGTRFNYSPHEASYKLSGHLFIPDSPGQLDTMGKENEGFVSRGKLLQTGRPVTLIGAISNDLFAQGRYLLSNVDLRVILTLENREFIMLCADEATDKSYIRIVDASLFIPHVTVAPDVLLAHERILHGHNALYNIRKIDVRTFTVSPNSNTFVLDNIVIGELPSLLIFGFVDADALNGKRGKNPFNFQHYNMQSFNLSVNGFQVLPKPLEFNFTKKADTDKTLVPANEAAHAYFRLYRELQLHMTDRACNISPVEFCNGTFLLPFDLTPDKTNDALQCA